METRRQPVEEDPLLPYYVGPTDRIQVDRLDTKPYLLSLSVDTGMHFLSLLLFCFETGSYLG